LPLNVENGKKLTAVFIFKILLSRFFFFKGEERKKNKPLHCCCGHCSLFSIKRYCLRIWKFLYRWAVWAWLQEVIPSSSYIG